MYNIDDALYVSQKLNLSFNEFTIEDLLEGMNLEKEHGTINQETNVTDDDVIKTAKIALAHLKEFPNYYNKNYGLKKFEEFLKNQSKRKSRF